MEITDDSGYGAQFDGWYDRLYPKDASADSLAQRLADLHPEPTAGTVEFGVGTGRVAIPLSNLVGEILGIDSSPEMLKGLARDDRSHFVRSELGDIRKYASGRRFGLVYAVCGTFSQLRTKQDQQQAVVQAAKLLIPGGRLVIETHNKDAIIAAHEGRSRETFFFPYPEPNTGVQMHSTLLPGGEIWHCSNIWFESDGTTRIGSEISRLTSVAEIDDYAKFAELEKENQWSNWEGAPLKDSSPMVIATYMKPGEARNIQSTG
ncbi:class I SAM-dependent methyltransferase [Streptomyces sp. NBC_01275]|uniref:methyltransferase domain-containing protein n=1 Tax=Streptomyces sp. NBC_01275 TaxID=2903807 RepID=UPI002253D537|nr:class I SAM-dependent methyltransferase [Streptomyces sp. NBC_01275]MCX4760394.1 class I SAM-dependent methyltransferase [Streptomyces sp. NBC_01275]